MKHNFKDNFSKQAAEYAKFRPQYPEALFHYLANLCDQRKVAWDCGTGNGQCAVPLAQFFDSVIATDPSEKQLAKAGRHPRIDYRLGSAESSGLAPESVDLITVAQALHWFPIDRFWDEVQRILRPNGVIAVWCYGFLEIAPAIESVLARFYEDIVGDYWDFERKLVEDGYRSISFPFVELKMPPFAIETQWSLPHLTGYLQSWSATQNFIKANGNDPIQLILPELSHLWGDPDSLRDVRWPLHFRVGRTISRNS
jgi:SAM-dependent methyltransferase